MADLKISQLSDGGNSQATDEYVIARSGANYRIDGASVAAAATSVGTLSSLTVSGDLTVDTNSLYVKSSTNQVGVGTTAFTTGAIFQVKTATDRNLSVRDVSSELSLEAVNDASTANVPLRYYASAHKWFAGANTMTLDASGNLGLGVTPQARFHMQGGDFLKTNTDYVAGSAGSGFLISQGASSGNTYTQLVAFQAGNTAYNNIVIPGGSVGIGTTNPTAKLSVRNDVAASVSVAPTSIDLYNNSDGGAAISFSNAVSAQSKISFGVESTGSGTDDSVIAFATNANGGALTERARIDASGNLGVGTASPDRRLDIEESVAGQAGARINNTSTANSSGVETVLELYNNVNAMARVSSFRDTNELRINNIANGIASFYTNNAERARITSGGDVEIGTQAGTGTRTLTIQTNTSGDPTLSLTAAGADSGSFWFERSTLRLYARASNTGGVYLASGGTSWTAVSDERQKDIIEDIVDATAKVSALRSVIGRYKTDSEDVRRSFLIAQDVAEAFPEAADVSDEDNLGVRYSDVIPLLVAAIKELTARLEALEA